MMMVNTTVTLSSNGKYWQAFYYDVTGKRRAKSLGAKSKLSKRKAKVLCDRLAADLQVNPGKGVSGLAPPCPELAKARPVVTMGDVSLGNRSGSDSLFQESTKKKSTAT